MSPIPSLGAKASSSETENIVYFTGAAFAVVIICILGRSIVRYLRSSEDYTVLGDH